MSSRVLYFIVWCLFTISFFQKANGQENYISKSNQQLAVDLMLEKAQIALQQANYIEADNFITSATYIAKDSSIYAQTQLLKISYLNKTGQLDNAIEVIKNITPYFDKSSLNSAQLLLLKSDVLINANRLVDAQEAITNAQLILAQTKNENLHAILKLRRAQLNIRVDKIDKARESFIALLPHLKNNKQYYLTAQVNLELAQIAAGKGELNLAKEYIENSITLADRYEFYDILKNNFYLYSQLLEQQGDYKNSVFYLQKYTKLTRKDKNSIASNVELLEFNKLKKEYEALVVSNNEKAKELKGKDTSYILLCVFITLLSLLTLSLFKNNKLRAKSNHVLEGKNSALIDERDRAQDAAKIKADFLSTITHELRTPMYAVTGLTHLLLETDPRTDQKEHLETLKSSGEYLLSLIDNILDFNKLEANKVKLEAISFDLNKRVNDISLSLKGQAKDQRNNLHIEYDDNIPSRLQGDPVKISQILINLMGNAIKFTKDGDVWLRAHKTNTIKDKCLIRFEVEDNGKGISKEKQQAIFENFTQEGSSTNREYGGTGLGLAIVKNLVELMGGTVQLESEVGIGSKFTFEIWFELPDSNKFFNENHYPEINKMSHSTATTTVHIKDKKEIILPNIQLNIPENNLNNNTEDQKPENPKQEIISSKPATSTQLLNKRILIVEDNKINQMITKKILEGKNFICEVANNGEEAVIAAKNKKYDLILMDVHMPIKDGKEATRAIRIFNKEIPILALTAVTLNESEKEFYEIGFDDIIPKPFKMDEFFEKIQKAFSNLEIL
ncbi:ATP-binding protein [uncultured Nonlabens sp.]|uniref:tetratricopeptide repeat-containing hybrid sensor histidine kinase/response regulator n=1 Tax=uncultured Nonlabens sp. TaxID=859306 RepID=UPI0026296B17|nr:ATP-binding protein [uncultured Nonlabens sp.]